MRKATFLLLLLTCCLPNSSFAQTWQWSAGCTGGSEGTTVTTDIWGNSIATGFSNPPNGSLNFGPVTLGNLALSAAVVVKYSGNGALMWAMSTHTGFARPLGAVADSGGNVYLLGYYTSDTILAGSFTLHKPATDSELFMVRLNPAGNVLWATNVCSGNISGNIATDGRYLFITSSFKDPILTIGAHTIANNDPSGSTYDFFLAKMDTSGGVQWVKTAGGSADDYSYSLAVTPTGNVYLSGCFNSPSISFGSATLTNATGSIFLAKYDSLGNVLWAQVVGGKAGFFNNVATDRVENVYVVGTFYKTTFTFGSTVFVSDTYSRAFLVKYDELGNIKWAKQVSGNYNVFGTGVGCDLCGNVWIGGNIPRGDTGFVVIEGSTLNAPPAERDPVYLAEFSPLGNYLTSTALPSGGDDLLSVTTDGVGNMYFGADYWGGPYTIGGATLNDPIHAYEDIFVAKFALNHDTARTHQIVCISDTVGATLQAPAGYMAYQWSNGSTAPAIYADSPGVYTVYAVGACNKGVSWLQYNVGYGKLDTTFVHTDTSICQHAHMALVAPPGYEPYLWSNGDTTQLDTVSASGTYWVLCSGTCSSPFLVDTFYTGYNSIDLAFTLGDDTNVCAPFLIQPDIHGVSFYWQDGTTNSSDWATEQGLYYTTVSEQGCFNSDSVYVYFPNLVQHLRDTVVCKDKPIQIELQANAPSGSTVLWSTGSTEHDIIANAAGKYWVKVSIAACSAADTMTVGLKYCYCTAFVPTAFTPNDDGLNDYFSPIIDPACDIYDYSFTIYNRWGQLIFTSHDMADKWDGKFHGVPQDIGVYMYYLSYRAGTSLYLHSYKGDVTLVK